MKPGVKTISAGALLFITSFIVPVLIVLPIILKDTHSEQFKVPGHLETIAKSAGTYYLWNDYCTVFEGTSYNRSHSIPDGIQIRVRDDNGKELPFISDTSTSASSGASAKNSIGYVEIDHPGKLEIDVSGGTEIRIFSFSKSVLLKMFGLIFAAVGMSLLMTAAGIGLVVWGIVKLVRTGSPKPAGPPGRLPTH